MCEENYLHHLHMMNFWGGWDLESSQTNFNFKLTCRLSTIIQIQNEIARYLWKMQAKFDSLIYCNQNHSWTMITMFQ